MTDDDARRCEELGKMSPAQVVQCAEGSNAECWVRAEVKQEDGSTTAYECCGGGGKKARFTLRTGFLAPRSVSPGDVPDGLFWSRRTI
jgi:hypothetical protein